MKTYFGLVATLLLVGTRTSISGAHGSGHGQKEEHPAQKVETPAPTPKPEAEVLKTLADYRAAMEARSTEKLEAVVEPGLLILEGVHKNVGWIDYRDNHIGPEMKDWKGFQVIDPKILEVWVDGDWAYAAQESTVQITLEKKVVMLASAETFVLRKGPGSTLR